MSSNKSRRVSQENLRRRNSFGRKLAAGSAAAAALYMAPGGVSTAEAGIIHNTTPVSISLGQGSVNWDVDGDATTDFVLETFFSSYLSINGGGQFVNLVSAFEDGIEGFDTVASQFDIGPNMAAPYFFGQTNAVFRTMISSGGYGFDALGWAAATQYVGFRTNAGLYGWASVTLDTGLGSITINEWAYEDSGAGIHMGATAIPEPTSAALSGLALLATGAAGARRRRSQQN